MSEIKNYITIKNIIFLILILLVLKFIYCVRELTVLIFASFVIAASLNPLVCKLQRFMSRSNATIVALSGFLAVIVGAFLPLVILVLGEMEALGNELPQRISDIQQFIATKTVYGTKLSTLLGTSEIPAPSTEFIGNALQKTLIASANIIGAFAVIFVICMIVYYMLSDKDKIRNWFLSLFPQTIRGRAAKISTVITTKVGGFVIAQCSSMLAVGVVTSIGLAILGIPQALALGLISGILDIVPIVGPIVATASGMLAAYNKGPVIILLVVFVYIIAQWISNNLMRPLIFGKFLDLHPLVILLSFLVAAEFLDVWGVILAPAIASVLVILFDELYIKQINKVTPEERKNLEGGSNNG